MIKNISLILACFVAGFVGSQAGTLNAANNVQPRLTGAGLIIFPENSLPANLLASSGGLHINAGGSNQNIIINPSGSGGVGINTSPAYLLDVAGDINTSGLYRAAGTPGQSSTITVVKNVTGTGIVVTTCTITTLAGIKTGGTC